MVATARPSTSNMTTDLQNRLTLIFVIGYSALVLFCFLLYPLFFIRSIQTPFIGAFVEHTLIVNTSQPTRPGTWELNQLQLPFGYQVDAINGERVTSVHSMNNLLRQYRPGDQATITLLAPDGAQQDYPITLARMPFLDQISYFILPYLIGLIYLVCGLYVFSARRQEPAGRAFAVFAASMAVALAGLYESATTNYLTSLWTASLAIVGGSLFNLAFLFPERARLVNRFPYLRWIGYLPAAAIAIYAVSLIGDFARPTAYVAAWRIEYIFMGAAAITFLSVIAWRRTTSQSPVVREQARLIFWGALLAFLPIVLWFFLTVLWNQLHFSSLLLLPLGVFPIFTGYAIIRYRLLSTDYLLSRTMLYALLTALVVTGYALLVTGFTQVFGDVLQVRSPIMMGLVVFILAAAINPARIFLQNRIDAFFYRGQIEYRERQQAFSRELTQALELENIISLLRRYVEQALNPGQLHIYVFSPTIGHYEAAPDQQGAATSDLRFPTTSALVQTLAGQRESLFLTDVDSLPAALQSEKARLALLGAQLFVPLPGKTQLIGWLALGERRSGDPYSNRDLEFLEAIGDQSALAVERSQVVTDLERRIREMNVLTRVAQGVSFTVVFDDILELISAQTNQILPARDFRVTLFDKETKILTHAFYLENDERLLEQENRPLPAGQGLEAAVVEGQRAILTDDYERECRGRGLLPVIQGVYAWMGVPLNAGAETIGVLSVASRDPAVLYTEEQRNLLQAIANQASGAIVKARLLEETENRARQLATLNEIGIGLTSTLNIKLLLNQILQSATDILNCEAGSLFLVDPQTDELVFEVVISPVEAQLTGRRLPPGSGLVGEAVETGKPIIANDAKRRKEWFEKTDQQTGFDTQDILAVPMRIHDKVIGVIELINKRNGTPFSLADQELLTAYTSQATIAIENARLYTMTDQALAARVEELSVMQRIDRELNASLDIDRAMRITLDWALRQSGVEAGLVGVVQENMVRVMVSQGYTDEMAAYRTESNGDRPCIPVSLSGLSRGIESGQPLCLTASNAPEGERFAILTSGCMQIVVPIRRETDTIGVLLLESAHTENCTEDLISFLTRLSDHAAIAIANAQLYEEVTEANLAKSRFVSFVAHELKNPMASIKGYTELVSGGMAGPINEMQSSFLGTVRSNVDRMNTIVSDLNDLTKIQTGNLRLEYKAVGILEVLEEVIRSMRRQIEEKEQKYQLDLPDDLPAVWADPSRLAQILTNLVSNAHKYTPASGEFVVGAQREQVKSEDLGSIDFVHIWVQDHGIGISEEDQKQIFQQYFRTDVAKEMASGTGLGLSITRSLVEMQGGRIWFNSQLGEGTTFHFTLPVAEAQ
ncbi:MAG: GAF domain-containing protein [Anaerolineales bacterium]|nr:GAF domain-containing protein [Anaerolineales bacterium]